MIRRRRIYEGKNKVLFEGPEPGTLVQYFKDDVLSGNPRRPETAMGKGVLTNRISEYLMLKLAGVGIPSNLVRRLNMREQLVRQVEPIPLELIIRNSAAGSFAERLGLSEGADLPRSVLEFFYTKEDLERPFVSDEHITAFGWAAPHEVDDMMALALRVNDYLSGLFLGIGLKLLDVRLVFGRLWDQEDMRIVLAEELSPESFRLLDLRTGERLDRERLGPAPERLADVYREIAHRLGLLTEGLTGAGGSSPVATLGVGGTPATVTTLNVARGGAAVRAAAAITALPLAPAPALILDLDSGQNSETTSKGEQTP